MKFAAIIDYAQDPEKITAIRPAHRQYLGELLKTGKLFVAGPFTDDTGALIVYEAESAEAAEELLRNDPFHAAGVFVEWELRPWKTVMGNRDLMPA